MKKIYLYPITSRNNTGITNPYINYLASSLSENYEIVNEKFPSNKGITDLLKYINRIDILYLNWIEDLPGKYMGILQTLFFFILLRYLKMKNKKIIWTLHNKQSHSGDHLFWKKKLFKLMLNRSDFILTHSEEGLKLIPPEVHGFYIPHPVKETNYSYNTKRSIEYDIIIWGTIAKYKAVDKFLNYLKDIKRLRNYRLLIAGKITDPDLEAYINKISHDYPNITVINKFVEESELNNLIFKSKIILFTYHSGSVLSSGALMDSLNYRKIIIGPHTGAFKDLAKEDIIYTFKTFSDLAALLEELKNEPEPDAQMKRNIKKFSENNSWTSFSEKFRQAIEESLD